MYKAIIAIGIVATACLVAGCGSSSDETAEAAVTKAQFVKQATAICEKARDEAQNAAAAWEKAKGKSLELDAAFTQVIGPALKQEARELQSLAVPEEDAARVARMFENLSEVAAAVTEGNGSRSVSASKAFRTEVDAYGLEACAL